MAGGLRTAEGARKSAAGRKPWDEVLIFKALVLQALYNLSDDQAEYQLRDRLSFMHPSTLLRRAFDGLGLEDAVPDAKTLWLPTRRRWQPGALRPHRTSAAAARCPSSRSCGRTGRAAAAPRVFELLDLQGLGLGGGLRHLQFGAFLLHDLCHLPQDFLQQSGVYRQAIKVEPHAHEHSGIGRLFLD